MKIFDVSDPGSLLRLEVHPLRSRARVLLTSVFGPYARDDHFGSRSSNPMELYHNQVTRVQGAFSLRMFHRSCGLMMIQANVHAPCTVLDYPDLDRFIAELRNQKYDIIGVSAIPQHLKKVQKMCELIRFHQPDATIVVGGHITGVALEGRIDADYVVRGEGIKWFRSFLGEEPSMPIKHPNILSVTRLRCMGVDIPLKSRDTAAVLIPSIGCPLGCDFCATSAFFGGKGKYVNFFETGDELFEVMCRLESEMRVRSFFVMDDNFLLQRGRALKLLQLMQAHKKSWSLYVFGSADALKSYTMDQLVGLGVSWVWLGLEGRNSRYGKLKGMDTRLLVRELQANGIRVMGSSIIGLKEHSPENIDEAIEWAVSHEADFHQFMLYTPTPGTPLYAEMEGKGVIYPESEMEWSDIHGQWRFNYLHPKIPKGQETDFLLRAFKRDFEANGPSIMRMISTTREGWKKHRNHPDPRVRARFATENEGMGTIYPGVLWAAKIRFRFNLKVKAEAKALLEEIYREYWWRSRAAALLLGGLLLVTMGREERRLAKSLTFEPPTFYQTSPEPERSSSAAEIRLAPDYRENPTVAESRFGRMG